MRRFSAFVGAGLVVVLSACSSSSSSGPDLNAFEGTWTPTAVNEVVTCNGKSTTVAVSDNLSWASSASTSGAIVSTSTSSSCTFTATVSGTTATAAAGQTCSQDESTSAGDETIDLTLTSYTFAVNSADTTATVTGAGSANVIIAGATTACTFTESGTYTKVTN